MAENRDQLEQQAMLLLQKDKKEEAVDVYLKILKLTKGDIRVRQKLADLYLALGRKPEAIRQLRDVAAGQMKEGQHRAAVVILKKLHELNPTDAQTLGMLGEAQRTVGFTDDAKEAYLKVIDMLEPKPKLALPYVQELISLCPGEVPPKVKLAEVLSRCGRSDEAYEQWVKLGTDSRRRGSTLDQALFLERALKIKENDVLSLEGAAEARIALGAPKEALVHIQKAYAVDPDSTRVLSMLGQCFELMEQQPKAKKVFIQLAKVFEERNEVVNRMDALQRASACDPEDAALASEVGAAAAMAERVQLRLTGQGWSSPADEAEAAVVVRARVLADYGFPDRAKAVLEKSNGVRESISVRAMMAEVLVQLDDIAGAITEMEAMNGGDEARTDIATRVLVLRGDFDSLGTGVEPADIEMSIEMDEEEEVSLDMEDDEEEAADSSAVTSSGDTPADHESEGDRLAEAGDTDGAIAAYQAALEVDPTNETVLMKLGEIFAADAGEVEEPTMETLAPIESVVRPEPVVPQSSSIPPAANVLTLDPSYVRLQGLVLLGRLESAQADAEERDDLLGACILAEIQAHNGDAKGARRTLQEAMDEVDEDAEGYAEGLWGLARYAAMLGKARTAQRLLGEMDTIAPGHRARESAILKAGMEG